MTLVGIGSGMFNSPNTAAMMGAVPVHRRGIASGTRMMLTNTGAVLSIAFVMAAITSAVPKNVLFSIFSGLASGLSDAQLSPVHLEHAPGALGARRRLAASARPSRCCARRTSRPTVHEDALEAAA